MRILLSIIFAIAAIAVYNKEYMLSSLKNITTHKSLSSLLRNNTRAMSTSTSAPAASSTAFHGLPVIPPTGELTTKNPRKIMKNFLAIEQSEGAGARVRRSIGTPKLRNFSPFLMLDHFAIPPGAGFPDHPHRGYVLSPSPLLTVAVKMLTVC